MRVIVTGGLGFIGSFTAEELLARGHEVTIIDRCRGNVVEDVPGATIMRQDARTVWWVSSADVVIHCAAPVGAVSLLSNGESITHEIVDVTNRVAAESLALNAPLINVSTSEVYGFSGTYNERDDLRVPDKHSARLEYAVGKIAGEHLLHGTQDLAFTNIRPFNVTGPRQTAAKGFVLPTFAEQATSGQPLTVFGDGTQRRAFTSVYDLARVICDIAEAGEFNRQTYNVGNPDNETSIMYLAKRVLDLTGSDSQIVLTDGKSVHGELYEEAEGHVKVPDVEKLAAAGITPPAQSLDDLIQLTLLDQQVTA